MQHTEKVTFEEIKKDKLFKFFTFRRVCRRSLKTFKKLLEAGNRFSNSKDL